VGVGNFKGQPGWYFMTVQSRESSTPVADAGPDQIVECAGENTPVQLNGGASRSPEGDPLTFEWRLGNELLGTSAQLSLGVSFGAYTFTLRVTDSRGASAEDTVNVQVIDTTPPVVSCPANVTASAGDNCLAPVPDLLGTLVATDLCTPVDALTKSQVPAAGTLLPLGHHGIIITVTDSSGNRATCSATFTVADTTAPVIRSISAQPAALHPLNHQMVPVTLSVSAVDKCGPKPVCRIISVTSSEPVKSTGHTAPDWIITGPLSVKLRAESTSKDTLRFYTITVACRDAAGNVSTSAVTVRTQKNKKGDVVPEARRTSGKGGAKK
jgi:hypothetical protein